MAALPTHRPGRRHSATANEQTAFFLLTTRQQCTARYQFCL